MLLLFCEISKLLHWADGGRSLVRWWVFPWSRFTVHRSPFTVHRSLTVHSSLCLSGVHQRRFFVGYVLRGTARTHCIGAPSTGRSLSAACLPDCCCCPLPPTLGATSYESCIIHTNNVSHATQFPPSTVSPGLQRPFGRAIFIFLWPWARGSCSRLVLMPACCLLAPPKQLDTTLYSAYPILSSY
ncbi:hypothetical protein K440DRAFT_393429 [Wilcoxina mikolae CBS 423.85]|nr:hypothetical protein K440DRAFT_393429 [Wilcoxina mikolae CBS 423.85]